MRMAFLLIITSIFTFTSAFTPSTEAGTIKIPDKIRVIVEEDISVLDLSIRGRYRITTIETKNLLKEGTTFFNIKIRPAEYGIAFGKDYFKIYAIEIKPERNPGIYLGKRLYRGTLQILRTKEGYLRAINVIDLEDYLKGVIYHEISHRWPIEAIKAQAIVSRTFALYQAQQNRDKYYHLKADVSSQVYGGVYGERYRANKAVDSTKGEVLLYKGELLPAFFHATCGGRTEDASQLWKVDLAPLKGVSCPYCGNSPHFSWNYDLPLSGIEKELGAGGYKVSNISSIEAEEKDRSGRVLQLLIKGEGSSIRISAKEFRRLLGPNFIRSTDLSVDIKNGMAQFKGRGWGHGVGMCQWGARALSKKGMTAEEILMYYYPGARIVKLDGNKVKG